MPSVGEAGRVTVVPPVTVRLLLAPMVTSPVTANVELSVVAPLTPNVPPMVALLVTASPVPIALKVVVPVKVLAAVPVWV